MRCIPITIATVVLAAATARSQETFLPVHDLLYEHAPRTPYLEILRTFHVIGARRFAGESYLGGVSPNESRFRDVTGRGHFTPEQLRTLLTALGMRPEMKLWGKSLVVPQAGAEAASQVLDELRQALPPRLSIGIRLTQTKGDKTRVRMAQTVQAEPGRLQVFGEVTPRAAVFDYNVEIAQAAMIANPEVAEVLSGVMVAIRPQMAPSGEWALLETIARCVDDDPEAKLETGHPGLGPIDRIPQDISEAGRVVLVRPGSRTTQRWSGKHGEFELELHTQWRLPQPVRPGGHDLGMFSMRGELLGFRSVPVQQGGDEDERGHDEERDDPWHDISELAGGNAQWLDGPDEDESRDAQRFIAIDTSRWAIGAAVMGWFESHKAGPEVEVRCFDVAAGTAWPEDGSVPEGAKALGSTRLSQVDGTWSASAVRSEYTVIRDWDAEVAQSARITDPRCARVSSGMAINVRRLGKQLEIEGEISRIVSRGAKTLNLSSPLVTDAISNVRAHGRGNNVSATQHNSPSMGLPADTVNVEHPVVAAVQLHFRPQFDGQQPAIHRTAAPELLGNGRELLVVVTQPK